MQLDLARSGQNRSLHIRIALVDGRNSRIALRLSHHGDLQHSGRHELRRQLGPQPLHALLFEQRLHLMRRTGQQDDDFFFAFILPADPLSGRAAVGIGQNDGPGDHIRLLEIVGRHLFPAARRKAAFQTNDDFRIAAQLQSQRVGHSFAGEVVFRRPQTAHEDHNFRARKSEAGRPRQMFAIVADDRLENHIDAQQVQPFREVKGIRVLAEGSQQLGADGDNLGIHG